MLPHTLTPRQYATRTERLDTLVIGAGQAGLAIAYHLAKRDDDFLVLEAAPRVGESWRRRWDSLRLFTPAAYSGLPGMGFPAHPAHLPDKDEVADYLERYAERFDLPIRCNSPVESMERDGDRYIVRAGATTYDAANVVVATGPFHRPRVPALASLLSPAIHQLHSSQYRSPFDLPDGDVLVVGAGNSGAQIAMELARFRSVWLSGRETGCLPRTLLGRDVYDWIWPLLTRFSVDTRIGRRMQARARRGDPLVGISPRQITGAGVRRVGRFIDVRDGRPICDAEQLNARVVVWCTGFAPDYRWMHLPITDEQGVVKHRRGIATDFPGLYFLGLRFQHTMTSALLGGVGSDAEFIAGEIARRMEVAVGSE
jgi:putative flavoprotein involved in K+ transport